MKEGNEKTPRQRPFSASISPGENKLSLHQQDLLLTPSSKLSQREIEGDFAADPCDGEAKRRSGGMQRKSGVIEQRKMHTIEDILKAEEQEEERPFIRRSSWGLSHEQLLLQDQLQRESSFHQGGSLCRGAEGGDLLLKAPPDQEEKEKHKTKKMMMMAINDDHEDNGSIRCIDVKIAVVGNVDSGKSTLVGVLSSRCLDDGRGLARSRIFNFPHEAQTGSHPFSLLQITHTATYTHTHTCLHRILAS